jgi:hypothetical protein
MIAARLAICLALSCPGIALGQIAASDLPGLTDIAPLAPEPGPPTAGFPYNVQQCWVVGALSPEAQRVRITLAIELGDDGRPLADGIRLIESFGGGAQATEQAFQSARRAILRCAQSDPHVRPLSDPSMRSLEITFDPSGASNR